MFGINKSGYIRSRYDAERTSDGTDYLPNLPSPLKFTIEVPNKDGDIYIMTDLYPIGVVPYVCRKFAYTSVTKYTATVPSSNRDGVSSYSEFYTPVVYTGVFSSTDSISNNGVSPKYGYSY